jgi:hypothetical protein
MSSTPTKFDTEPATEVKKRARRERWITVLIIVTEVAVDIGKHVGADPETRFAAIRCVHHARKLETTTVGELLSELGVLPTHWCLVREDVGVDKAPFDPSDTLGDVVALEFPQCEWRNAPDAFVCRLAFNSQRDASSVAFETQRLFEESSTDGEEGHESSKKVDDELRCSAT